MVICSSIEMYPFGVAWNVWILDRHSCSPFLSLRQFCSSQWTRPFAAWRHGFLMFGGRLWRYTGVALLNVQNGLSLQPRRFCEVRFLFCEFKIGLATERSNLMAELIMFAQGNHETSTFNAIWIWGVWWQILAILENKLARGWNVQVNGNLYDDSELTKWAD